MVRDSSFYWIKFVSSLCLIYDFIIFYFIPWRIIRFHSLLKRLFRIQLHFNPAGLAKPA